MEIESTHKWKKYLPILGVVVGVVVIVIIVLILMRGTTTTSGGYPNPESTKSLSCNSDTYTYQFFKYDNSTKKNTTGRSSMPSSIRTARTGSSSPSAI